MPKRTSSRQDIPESKQHSEYIYSVDSESHDFLSTTHISTPAGAVARVACANSNSRRTAPSREDNSRCSTAQRGRATRRLQTSRLSGPRRDDCFCDCLHARHDVRARRLGNTTLERSRAQDQALGRIRTSCQQDHALRPRAGRDPARPAVGWHRQRAVGKRAGSRHSDARGTAGISAFAGSTRVDRKPAGPL